MPGQVKGTGWRESAVFGWLTAIGRSCADAPLKRTFSQMTMVVPTCSDRRPSFGDRVPTTPYGEARQDGIRHCRGEPCRMADDVGGLKGWRL